MARRLSLLAGAALTVLLVASSPAARADGVLPAAATAVQREQAQSRFARGKDLMNKQSYDAALVEFRASHEIVASPNTRLELARCLVAMGKLVDAYAELGRTAIEAKELMGQDNRYQRAYAAATAERAQIQPKLGFVSLTIENATDDTKLTVGGEEIRRAAWSEPAPVLAGSTDVVATTPGRAPVTRSVTLAAGASTTLTIDAQAGAPTTSEAPAAVAEAPVAEPSSGSSLRTWAYVAGGAGVVGVGAFAIFGAMAHAKYSRLESDCPAGLCPASDADTISGGRTDKTIANVGLVVGVLGLAGGATLFVLSRKKDEAPAASLVVAPSWVGVRGSL
ncbi:MAG TPA: hypothetical protein VHV30_15870 [Polyangiaceae bacterium]|jgi:hypothetical protein|nr:hypothetical protein [Polyangiaceae bacterium]